MITILSGQNDICSGDPCYPSAKSAALEHYENLRKALDYLQANLPRTFVNLLPVLGNIIWRQSVTLFKHYLFLDVTAGWRIEKSLLCGVMSVIECRCLYGPGGAENIQKLKAVVKAYHSAEKQLVRAPAPFNRIMLFISTSMLQIDSGRYDSKEDFTVVIQPFTSNLEAPKARNFLGFDLADLSLFSVDCFHLSQKGHASCEYINLRAWGNTKLTLICFSSISRHYAVEQFARARRQQDARFHDADEEDQMPFRKDPIFVYETQLQVVLQPRKTKLISAICDKENVNLFFISIVYVPKCLSKVAVIYKRTNECIFH